MPERSYARSTVDGEGRRQRVFVTEMADWTRAAWDDSFQPEIDAIGERAVVRRRAAATNGASQPEIEKIWLRPDAKWRWRSLIKLIGFAVSLPVEGLDQAARGYALNTRIGLDLVPVGMLQICERFSAEVPAIAGNTVFVSFLSTAPDPSEILRPGLKLLGQLTLDIAVRRSFQLGYQGTLLLHADPKGESWLPRWYSSLGMNAAPQSVARVSENRPNDGRYFYFDPSTALAFSNRLDEWR